jgi:heme oxygenase
MHDLDSAASTPSRARLATRLREETARTHAAVERLPVMVRLTSADVTREDYLAYLALLAEVYGTLEPGLLACLDAELHQAAGLRCKLPAILDDLATHGRTPTCGALCVPPPSSLAAALGGLYVLEGATLGGRVILKHLRRHLGPALGSTVFLDFHGEQASVAWRRFTAVIDGLADAGRVDAEAVVAGAQATFASVYHILSNTVSGSTEPALGLGDAVTDGLGSRRGHAPGR